MLNKLANRFLKKISYYTFFLRRDLRVTAKQNKVIAKLRPVFLGLPPGDRGTREKELKASRKKYYDVLLYAPLSPQGLTTQVTQLVRIFDKLSVSYRITHTTNPSVDHEARKYWIDPRRVGNPELVLYLERFPEPHGGYLDAYKVYYINLDWLRPKDFIASKKAADLILYPIDYKLDHIKESYRNSVVKQMKWPAICEVNKIEDPEFNGDHINVLYIGNDIDEVSRKNPYAVLSAIQHTKNDRLRFMLKFRPNIPSQFRAMIAEMKNVSYFSEDYLSDSEVEDLYEKAHINLIPNDSEGNGLSIVESMSKGVVPAVLNGKPMNEIVSPEYGYLIDCEENGTKGQGLVYQTTHAAITKMLDQITMADIVLKRKSLIEVQEELIQRSFNFENTIVNLLKAYGLPYKRYFGERPAEEEYAQYRRKPSLIDVYMTTTNRASVLKETFKRLMEAVEASPFEHRVTVMIDELDTRTLSIISPYSGAVNIITNSHQMGLPFFYNLLIDHSKMVAERSERVPDYICYIQDDCLITSPKDYFRLMVEVHSEVLPRKKAGYVSGFHCPIHPGFEKTKHKGNTIVLSDSIDGKNFMAPPHVLYKVGKLTWHFKDGERRGNPGPTRGSHFDLWQWKESKSSLMKQGRVNLIIPGLCEHLCESVENSTWRNSTTEKTQSDRIARGEIYKTRDTMPDLSSEDYFRPGNG